MNKYLTKLAELNQKVVDDSWKKDAVDTGLIAAAGGADYMILNALNKRFPHLAHLSGPSKFGLGAGISLIGDYAAVKGIQALDKMRNNKDIQK